MRTFAILILASTLTACASIGTGNNYSIGRLVFAGPMGAKADVVSIKWSYGIQFAIDPKTINQVSLTCAPIAGSTFVVQAADIKSGPNGVVFMEGETLPVSTETTPWLFEPNTTSTVCKAVVSREGMPDATVRAPVSFAPAVKAATVGELKMAHEYNSKLKK